MFNVTNSDVNVVFSYFGSSPTTGLTNEQVDQRLKESGYNEFNEDKTETILSRILDQLKNPLVLLLLGSAIISVFIGEYENAFSIIAERMRDTEDAKTPLQMKMDFLGRQLSLISFGIIALILVIGLIQKRPWLEMFTVAVSLAVAAIPEGLPINGKEECYCEKDAMLESLGCIDTLCLDKTGTITLNKMTATKIFLPSNKSVINAEDTKLDESTRRLLLIANLCNNAYFVKDEVLGNATESALLRLCLQVGLEDERINYDKVDEIPFSSETKFMAVKCAHKISKEEMYYVKGSFATIIQRCPHLDEDMKKEYYFQYQILCSQGLRVLAFGFGPSINFLEFSGFIASLDPPRPNAAKTINKLQKIGVRVVMITGDSKETAESIARSVGIQFSGLNCSVSGSELEAMPEHMLVNQAPHISVIYRATPKNKMEFIKALQSKGHVVGMSGDGVNDSPALKVADIGISMGESGTDVSREAAKIILVKDDLSCFLDGIEEGKSIYHNVRGFLRFQLSTSIAALMLISVSTLFGFPSPLNATQILWINIIMDGPPAQSLGVEPVDPQVFKEPPRNRDAAILTFALLKRIFLSSFIILLGSLFIFISELKDGKVTSRDTTMTFTTFVMFGMFNVISCRSETKSITKLGIFTNIPLLLSIVGSLLAQLVVIYVPFFQRIFLTEPIYIWDILKIVFLSSSLLLIEEFIKAIRRSRSNQNYVLISPI
ncbi:calcium ATPase [Rozella allomycis CSF55]|uniref:Calcium ATPase n=1 Tax=Rozella allomycis (strain CSF55) TaxID=988480 RepID=A0A4P9YJW1_ROZAC|nr:calcium ATPase [Rozella allomycis CSF55]